MDLISAERIGIVSNHLFSPKQAAAERGNSCPWTESKKKH